MRRAGRILVVIALAMIGTAFPKSSNAGPVSKEQLSFDTNPGRGVKPAKLSATLYLPRSTNPVSTMVIISSSGGVLDWIEGYYARELAKSGIGALVVDSFKPRGVRNVIANQSLVSHGTWKTMRSQHWPNCKKTSESTPPASASWASPRAGSLPKTPLS
jgi:dienelactone hydrolase